MAESEWTDELKQEVIEAYKAQEPTPETTLDIIKEIAENYDKTPNSIRMILVRAGEYVKKEAKAAAKSSSSSSGSKRISKADAIDGLKAAIEKAGKEVDDDICDRLTGKAALYFTGLFSE